MLVMRNVCRFARRSRENEIGTSRFATLCHRISLCLFLLPFRLFHSLWNNSIIHSTRLLVTSQNRSWQYFSNINLLWFGLVIFLTIILNDLTVCRFTLTSTTQLGQVSHGTNIKVLIFPTHGDRCRLRLKWLLM